MRILIVNPNTTRSMTEKAGVAGRSVAAAGTEIVLATSSMGPASIEGFYDGALAVPGLLAAIKETGPVDAAIIACFDDTGLDAARSMCDFPVLGLCESAVATAGLLARQFSIVTTLERSRPVIQDLVQRYGMDGRVKVRAADIPVLSLEDESSNARTRLKAEIARALEQDSAEAIVLGCAGMTDLARSLQSEFQVPVIDGVSAAVKLAEALFVQGLTTGKRRAYASPLAKRHSGIMEMFSVD